MTSKESLPFKNWKLNVIISYDGQKTANSYRHDIIEIFKHFASIYQLDYAISIEHPFFSEDYSNDINTENFKADLLYFRSNTNSRIDRKKLNSVIDSIFSSKSSPLILGVEVFRQLYKKLPEYPFPNDFYRPLNYPYVEFHQGLEKKLCIHANEAMKIIGSDQN